MNRTPPSQDNREREKAERLAAALRANLRRRKTQARAIDTGSAALPDAHDKD